MKNKILYNLYTLKSIGYIYHDDIHLQKEIYNLNLPNDLKEISNVSDNCNLCNLYKKDKKDNFYISNNNAKIVFVTLKPMVINNTFDNILKNVLNLGLDQITILSILKCNISDNEEEILNEIALCKNYINKQLELINPKLIISLGNSYKYLLNIQNELPNISGKVMKYKNIDLLAIYHPNMLLRNPSLKKETMENLKKLKGMINKL